MQVYKRKGRAAAFQADERGVRLSTSAPLQYCSRLTGLGQLTFNQFNTGSTPVYSAIQYLYRRTRWRVYEAC